MVDSVKKHFQLLADLMNYLVSYIFKNTFFANATILL